MTNLIAAAVFFILIHRLVSGTQVRDVLIRRLGQKPYQILFSLVSLAALVWLGFAFAGAHPPGASAAPWSDHPAARLFELIIQLLATLLIVPGVTTPNPTSVAQEDKVGRDDIVRGMLRITRHPFLWGVALWAGGHLLVSYDLASYVLFGSLLFVSVAGTRSIDAKRARVLGREWIAFTRQTSNIPFAAIAAGRQHFAFDEIGWSRVLFALVVWAALTLSHPYLFGSEVMPWAQSSHLAGGPPP